MVVNGSDHIDTEMDNWRVAVLGDGGVGKTALAVQVSSLGHLGVQRITGFQFTLNCFVGKLLSVLFPIRRF